MRRATTINDALQVSTLDASGLWSGSLSSDFVLMGLVYEVEGAWTIHSVPVQPRYEGLNFDAGNLISISYLRDRRSFWHLYKFFCVMAALPLALALVIALTPFGTWLYGTLFGGSPEVIRQAQQATLVLMLSAPVLMLRALAFGMIMLNRRTALITLATFLRLLSLGASLFVLPYWLQGSPVGAAALVICMTVESVFAFAMSWRYFLALPPGEGPKPTYGEMWRFAWPVILNQTSESGVGVVINISWGGSKIRTWRWPPSAWCIPWPASF